MSRIVSGENFTFDVKYVAGVSWRPKTSEMVIQTKGSQYTCIEATREEFLEVREVVRDYIKAKDQ